MKSKDDISEYYLFDNIKEFGLDIYRTKGTKESFQVSACLNNCGYLKHDTQTHGYCCNSCSNKKDTHGILCARKTEKKEVSFKKTFKMITADGKGFKLDKTDVDATWGRRAFFLNPCPEAEAIEVTFTDKDAIKIISGHHTLGYCLDNWYDKCEEGNRQHFSNWHEHSFWQFNEDMTISPRGKSHLVIG